MTSITTGPFQGLPRNHFAAIYADPPWPFKTWSPKGLGRSGEAHYQTLSYTELAALPVGELAADDAVLFMWILQTQIPEAVRLFEAWGFKLKSVASRGSKVTGSNYFLTIRRCRWAWANGPGPNLNNAGLAHAAILSG